MKNSEKDIEGKKIYCADLFCGGGGTSTGMIAAFEKRGFDYELVGVNHWEKGAEHERDKRHVGDLFEGIFGKGRSY